MWAKRTPGPEVLGLLCLSHLQAPMKAAISGRGGREETYPQLQGHQGPQASVDSGTGQATHSSHIPKSTQLLVTELPL